MPKPCFARWRLLMIPAIYNAANVRLYAAGRKHCYKGPSTTTTSYLAGWLDR